ncbi:MAG: MFS transporter [Actinobacteria bacterium]|nr:MFS transporter [Actinomycetota bacterium]
MSNGLGPDFNRIWSAGLLTNLADGVLRLAAPLLAITLTRDPVLISLLSALSLLPWLFLAVPIGAVVDRVDRRKALFLGNLARAIIGLAVSYIVYQDAMTIEILLLATFLWGVCEVLVDTTSQAILPEILKSDQLERGNSRLNTAEVIVAQFVGSPLGGLLYAVAIALPFFLSGIGFAIAALIVSIFPFHTSLKPAERAPDAPDPHFLNEIKFGIKYMYEEKRIDSNSYEKVTLHNIMPRNAKWYNKLDDAGIVRQGMRVVKGDVLVSKISVISKPGAESQRDSSICTQHDQEGVVHRVIVTTNTDGYQLIKIVIRQTKIPEIGDKFASRSAQKGTLGMTFRQEDMPFTRDGIVPDIIINPNAIPSRMTIAQLLECVLGKAGSMEATLNDSTPFTANSVNIADEICNRLASVGFERDGSEMLCNGMTGERMRAKVFIGPTYYQRLKHMVGDKIHARADGDVQILTNQPLEGRSRGGGLRLGEMERDALIAHGTSNFLRERLYTMSDPYEVVVCYGCGSTQSKQHECRNCGSDDFAGCGRDFPCVWDVRRHPHHSSYVFDRRHYCFIHRKQRA